ncbi:MAG: 2,5-diketo-D-gluconate reductase [Pseudonocardiales bacterium]|jgi:diketogulonate reductase-like aldo/keto reductase|nr:2,5-diketo-D-gluconate reductase [Pseudonocardiales bacterium]
MTDAEATQAQVPTIRLNTGARMPQLGFGVFQVPAEDVEDVVTTALAVGYRSIDTAAMYRNEEGVGRALKSSGIARDELFVTTKLSNPAHRAGAVERAVDESLGKLGLDRLDLYLIHWPLPPVDRYVEVWNSLAKIHSDGRITSIGVSNFQPAHLERLFAESDVVPAVNQVELHPYLAQEALRRFHAEHGIATEAWSPLGAGGELLEDETVSGIAEKYGVTPAQAVIRWHLQVGNVVIPKSVTAERIRSNFDVFGFELDPDDVDAISGLDRDERLGPDPDTFNP